MDASGGLVTEGGAVKCQVDENCFNHIINAHVQKGWHATGIWRSSAAHKCLKVRGNIILCYGRTIPFQFSRVDGSQKALCLSQHMCEKSLVHSKLVTAYKGIQRVSIEESQRSIERVQKVRKKRVKCTGGREKDCRSGELSTSVGVRLTAAVLIRAVKAVCLFITLVTGWDADAIGQAFKLLRSTSVTRTLGGCSYDKKEIYCSVESLVNAGIN